MVRNLRTPAVAIFFLFAYLGPGVALWAQDAGGCVFLMQPTTMEELRSVCGAGDLMPQKSTYFYPKLASGLVVNPLVER